MTDLRLNPQPDWPDRCRWERGFAAQFLHDHDTPARDGAPWNDAEVQDLIAQWSNDVSFEEIARRHQRRIEVIKLMHLAVMTKLKSRLLR